MTTTASLPEIAPGVALREIRAQLPFVLDWLRETREQKTVTTRKFWYAPAGTFVYHTTTSLVDADPDLLEIAAAVFAGANRLASQPWYPAFMEGDAVALELDFAAPFTAVASGHARFDFGLGKPRVYQQLIASLAPDANTRVVALRSIAGAQAPAGTIKAYTLGPTMDVFQLEGERLYWHHIVTAGGAGLLPPGPDKWLMNTLRVLGLDRQERQTYRDEAVGIHTLTREQWFELQDEIEKGSVSS
jgi:hypothetical protein